MDNDTLVLIVINTVLALVLLFITRPSPIICILCIVTIIYFDIKIFKMQ